MSLCDDAFRVKLESDFMRWALLWLGQHGLPLPPNLQRDLSYISDDTLLHLVRSLKNIFSKSE